MKLIKRITIGAVTLTALASSMPSLADLTMGIFPRRPAAVTNKLFKPLAEMMSQQLGEKVDLVVTKDFKSFWAGVESGKFDIVHLNQYHYILAHDKQGYQVFAANEENGSRTIAGAITVRKDSGIDSLAGLKGKTILFGGGRKAMGSYIAPTALLKKEGLKEGVDYTAQFAKNPPGAAISLFHKAADAAGTGNVILGLGAVKKKIDVSQLKILAESEPYVQLPWAARKDMDPAKVKKIAEMMISLPKGDAVLESAKVTAFFSATDADFEKVREIADFALSN